jgi:hypothetical protein
MTKLRTIVLKFLRLARRAKDGSPMRQHWENDGPTSAPERGARTYQPFFRPVPGLVNAACYPRLCAVGYCLSPFGLSALDRLPGRSIRAQLGRRHSFATQFLRICDTAYCGVTT